MVIGIRPSTMPERIGSTNVNLLRLIGGYAESLLFIYSTTATSKLQEVSS